MSRKEPRRKTLKPTIAMLGGQTQRQAWQPSPLTPKRKAGRWLFERVIRMTPRQREYVRHRVW